MTPSKSKPQQSESVAEGGKTTARYRRGQSGGRVRGEVADRQAQADAPSAAFWRFVGRQAGSTEDERLRRIERGLPPNLAQGLRSAFGLDDQEVSALLGASPSTIERRKRDGLPLDGVACERLDRIAEISHLALTVFEDRTEATAWMARPNQALGGDSPIMRCMTGIGAQQARRILHALEWGGAA